MDKIFSELSHEEILELKETHLHITRTLPQSVLEEINKQVYYPHMFTRGFFYANVLDKIIYNRESSLVGMVTPCLLSDVTRCIKNQLVAYVVESGKENIIQKYPELFV